MKQANDLMGVLREANQAINPKLFEMAEMGNRYGGRGGDRNRRWGFVPRGDSNGYGGGGGGGGFKRKWDDNGASSYGGAPKRSFNGGGSYGSSSYGVSG